MGATLPVWIGVMRRHRWPVAVGRLTHFLLPTATAPLNSLAALAQTIIFGRRIGAVAIDAPPIVVVGFMRTGTTLVHELLARDPRHTAPTMYQCLAPAHFLVTAGLATALVDRLLPRRRPMDDMRQGVDRPFEDEFALCLSGLASPYLFFFFPRSAARHDDDPDDPASAERWRTCFVHFLRAVLLARPGRLVLKSPPHTARVARLLDILPAARFVHMVRDPRAVVPSAIHTVSVLIEYYGLQRASADAVEDWVFRHFELAERRWDVDRARLSPDRFIEVRYEDFVADPLAGLERIYATLGLGPFAPARAPAEGYLREVAGHRTNRFARDAGLERRIVERFGSVIQRYGYT
jgi:hypothetical protein